MTSKESKQSGLVRALAFFTGGGLVGVLTQVIKGKLTAVFLGTYGVGILNQLTSFWGLFSTVSGLGFYNGMVRNLSGFWGEDDKAAFRAHISTSTFFLMGFSLILTFLGCLNSGLISNAIFADGGQRADYVALILLSVPIFIMAQIYKAILNATRSTSGMVKSRMAADIASVAVLAILIWPLGLQGAILAYIALHALFLLFSVLQTRKIIGSDILLPKPKLFDWKHIRSNLGFGLNGLVMVSVGIITAIIVSRWVIKDFGAEENGIYSMAVKVGTVYLAGFTAAAGGYYFPTLAAAKNTEERTDCINSTLSFYFYLMPPIMIGLMSGGEIMMQVLFSKEFIPAAVLLLFLLPADLFRLIAELLGLPLIVEKRLIIVSSLYTIWAGLYLFFGATLLPIYGIAGLALAYLLSQICNAVFLAIAIRGSIGYRISKGAAFSILRGALAVFLTAVFLWFYDGYLVSFAVSAFILGVWFVLSLTDAEFMRLVRQAIQKSLGIISKLKR